MSGSIEDMAVHKVVLTEKECAERLGISFWTLRKLRVYGHAPHIRLGSRIYYVLDAIKEWLEHTAQGMEVIRVQ